MYRIWSERAIPSEYLPLLEGVAVPDGCGGDTPTTPFLNLPGRDAIIASSRLHYNGAVMDQVPTLRVIARTGIGVNNVDLDAATERGIMVCNVPDGPSVSTAEHAITLMLAVTKHLKQSDDELRRAARKDYFTSFGGIEVRGRTLGVVGLGRIGGRVAQMGAALGMQVVGYDPFLSGPAQGNITIVRTLDELFAVADVVSLHVPCTPETHYLINRDTIARMKLGTYLVNCARGCLVDEAALIEALDSGHIRGAGLDVFEVEPPATDHPLLNRLNVIVTPHIAGATDISKSLLWRGAITQVVQVLRGERPQHLVNREVVTATNDQ